MGLIDCLDLHPVDKDTKKFLQDRRDAHLKNGLHENDADRNALSDLHQKLHADITKIRTTHGLKTEKYIAIDNRKTIADINKKYDLQKEDINKKYQAPGKPMQKEQPVNTKNHKVVYENGKRVAYDNENKEVPEYVQVIEDENGKWVAYNKEDHKESEFLNHKNKKIRTVKNVKWRRIMQKHEEAYNYDFGEKAPEATQGFNDLKEAAEHFISNSKNPAEIAQAYAMTPKEGEGLSSVEQAIAIHGVGKIQTHSFYQVDDKNNSNNSLAHAYLVGKDNPNGQTLDQVAKSISDHAGVHIEPQDVADFMKRFPGGGDPMKLKETDIHQEAAKKFEELTGIPLNDRTADLAVKQLHSPEELKTAENHAIEEVTQVPDEETLKWLHEDSNYINFDTNELSTEIQGSSNGEAENGGADQQQAEAPTGSDANGTFHPHETAESGEHEKGGDTGNKQSGQSSEAENVIQQQGLHNTPIVKEFIENDVQPVMDKFKLGIADAIRMFINTISPKTGVAEKAITHIMNALGERNESILKIDKTFTGLEKMFDKMTDAERVSFIDNVKTGKKQATPELQGIADGLQMLDKDLYDEITQYKPSLPWKENHFRVLWKEVPGQAKVNFFSTLIRRPLQGSRGFMKKATLADMSEGIAMGGVPHTTNPIRMFKLAYNDGMKYITAQKMFAALKTDKFVQFVKNGGKVPNGFTRLNDSMATVYFPTPEGLVKTGEYYIEEGAGRILNNHLSPDKIRQTQVGKGLMEIKNLYTQMELGLSGFHAIAMSLEATSSSIGMGLRKIINLGFKGDIKAAGEGFLDILKSPFASKNTYTTGRNAIKLASEKDFENSEIGKEFLKRMPDAVQYIHDYHNGGGLMKQHDEMRSSVVTALKEQAGKNNFIGASLRALPAINEMILDPLFNHYIPALKAGMFFKEFPLTLKENEARLASGKVTREQLARQSVSFIDDRLGEMNFDNLFWDRTFKTSMQFMLRSVTWKLGNIRAMSGAPVEQMIEFRKAYQEQRSPVLMPKMAWLFGLTAMQVALASTIQHMLAHKELNEFKDIVAPQIDEKDQNQRIMLPTYYKDMLHLKHGIETKGILGGPVDYIQSSSSGPIGKVVDLWQNKDFYHYEIYNPHGTPGEKAKAIAGYFAPKPFSISSALALKEKGEPTAKVLMSFLGLNKAPGYLTHTEIENDIFNIYQMRNQETRPYNEKLGNEAKKQIKELYKEGKTQEAEDLSNKSIKDGVLRASQIKFLVDQGVNSGSDASTYFFRTLPFDDKKFLYNKMTKEEKDKYDPNGTFAEKLKPVN